MKKITVVILSLVMTGFSSSAQVTLAKKPAHPVTDSVAVVMCTCIMSNKDSLTALILFYAVIDSCIKQNSAPRMDKLLKEDGFVQTDDRKARAAAVRVVGRKLGQKVAKECTGFKELLDNLKAKENKPELH